MDNRKFCYVCQGLFYLRLNHWLAHVSGMSQLNECVNVNECDSVKVRFSDPGKNALKVIKYKLHGSFGVFQWKRKGRTSKTFKAAVPVTVHICCKCCHRCAQVRACVCGQLFSGGVQLFYTGIPAHLAARLSLGSRGLANTQQRSGKIKD